MRFYHSQVDFTSCNGLFCVLAMVVLVTGIVTAIVLSFQYVSRPYSLAYILLLDAALLQSHGYAVACR